MAYKVQKPCKVCGRMYTPCFDCEQDNKTFRWRTVACSMKCGMEYFRMVEEARKPKVETKEAVVEETIASEDNIEVVDVSNKLRNQMGACYVEHIRQSNLKEYLHRRSTVDSRGFRIIGGNVHQNTRTH